MKVGISNGYYSCSTLILGSLPSCSMYLDVDVALKFLNVELSPTTTAYLMEGHFHHIDSSYTVSQYEETGKLGAYVLSQFKFVTASSKSAQQIDEYFKKLGFVSTKESGGPSTKKKNPTKCRFHMNTVDDFIKKLKLWCEELGIVDTPEYKNSLWFKTE